jgi:hypothetical protein
MSLVGWDIDGSLIGRDGGPQRDVDLTGCVVISGRTFAEYDDVCRKLAQVAPVYIRGVGRYGDHEHAARFKVKMINMLGVTEYHEDRVDQADMIRRACPECRVVVVSHD